MVTVILSRAKNLFLKMLHCVQHDSANDPSRRRTLAATVLVFLLPFVILSGASGQTTPPLGKAPDYIEILVVGDTLPESPWKGKQDLDHFLDGVKERLRHADVVFGNLEGPITQATEQTPWKSQKALDEGRDYLIRMTDPQIPAALKAAGFTLVGLANNHVMDYQEQGLLDTIAALDKAELPYVGAGRNQEEAGQAWVFTKKIAGPPIAPSLPRPGSGRKQAPTAEKDIGVGTYAGKDAGATLEQTAGAEKEVRIAFLAFSDVVPKYAWADPDKSGIATAKEEERLMDAIREARKQADYVVLMMHWGAHALPETIAHQRFLGRLAIRIGADAVVGMHPHVLQGVEWYRARNGRRGPIFYSLANFAYASRQEEAKRGAMARIVFDATGLKSAGLIPIEISEEGAPRLAQGSARAEILKAIVERSEKFRARMRGAEIVMPKERKMQNRKAKLGQPVF